MADIKLGDIVSWNSSGGKAGGKVERIIRDGSLKVPNTDLSIESKTDDPAVLIRIYRDGKPTDTMVGHKMSALSKSLNEEVEKYNPNHGAGGRFASGGGGGGAGGLTPSQDKQVNQLAVDMFNHKQSVPMSMKLGRMKTPSAQAHIQRGQQIVSQAHAILGGTRADAMNELNRRMGG